MRRAVLLAGLITLFLATLASPAHAAQVSVLASENVSRYDSTDLCGVFIDDYDDNEVNAVCFGEGRTWVKVRVPGVDGDVNLVKVTRRGDCSGIAITYSKRGDVVTVKITETGEFDCYYKRVTVRFS